MTGRLIGVMIGLLLMTVGIVLTLTVAGAIIGLPLGFIGLLLTIRSLF